MKTKLYTPEGIKNRKKMKKKKAKALLSNPVLFIHNGQLPCFTCTCERMEVNISSLYQSNEQLMR